MYEGWEICPTLEPKQVCFRCQIYRDGRFDSVHHQHVAKVRLSQERIDAILSSFVIRYYGDSGMGFEQIVGCHVNDRPGDPARFDALRFHVSYPEPGVLRHYCGTNTKAWADWVISPSQFRSSDQVNAA
ncbi:MAG: hypothetical protein AB7O98_12855 [Hyphomonadaceae bacterium]